MGPKVSVIMPVYNCLASIDRSLSSVFAQTLDAAQIEIIVVDDGSTDGSGELLDELAKQHDSMVVLHQPNSGGPGQPRNVGIEKARGEYLFFLDSDDWLGPEALERMCAMADENRTDVVLGKMVGVGRRIPPGLFQKDVPRTTILNRSPSPYDTLSPLKLFRRALVERENIRFVPGVISHEDQIFTARAYLEADGISILSSYDCYYWVSREDGTSVIQQGGAKAAVLFPLIDEVMTAVAERIEAGPDRDWLHRRHFRDEIFSRLGPRYLQMSEEERRDTRDGARLLMERWLTPWIRNGSLPYRRIVAWCVLNKRDDLLLDVVKARVEAQGDPGNVLHNGRAYVAYPHFGTGPVPDDCYDATDRVKLQQRLTDVDWDQNGHLVITGEARIDDLTTTGASASLILRNGDEEHRTELEVNDSTFIGAVKDLARLSAGNWDVHLEYTLGEITRTARLGTGSEDAPNDVRRQVEAGCPVVAPVFTAKGELRISVGALSVTDVTATRKHGVIVQGRLSIPAKPQQFLAELRRRGSEETHPAHAVIDTDGVFTIELSLRGLRPGRWDLRCQTDDETWHRVPLPAKLLEGITVGKAADIYTTLHGGFAITVTAPVKTNRARRLLHRVPLLTRH